MQYTGGRNRDRGTGYVEDLKSKFSSPCAIDDDDLRGLRERTVAGAGRSRAAVGAGWLAKARARAARGQGRQAKGLGWP